MQTGDHLAQLPLEFLGRFLEPLRGELGTQPVRAGSVSRRSGNSLSADRLHEIVRETAGWWPAVGNYGKRSREIELTNSASFASTCPVSKT